MSNKPKKYKRLTDLKGKDKINKDKQHNKYIANNTFSDRRDLKTKLSLLANPLFMQ